MTNIRSFAIETLRISIIQRHVLIQFSSGFLSSVKSSKSSTLLLYNTCACMLMTYLSINFFLGFGFLKKSSRIHLKIKNLWNLRYFNHY